MVREAAANGNHNAQWKLGLGYIKGIGVPHDEPKAAVWFNQAANHGDLRAQRALSDLYFERSRLEVQETTYVRMSGPASLQDCEETTTTDRGSSGSRMTAAQDCGCPSGGVIELVESARLSWLRVNGEASDLP